jgi:predicted metal-dependent hydrolase
MTTIQRRKRVRYGTSTIDYLLVKSKRIKTSEIIVDADKVTIRTPLNKDLSEIRGIVSNKASWILKKQKECRERILQITKPTFKENSTLLYLGKNYPFRILKKQPTDDVRFIDGEFIIKTNSTKKSSTATEIKQLYDDWLMNNAQSMFTHKVEEYSKELGVKPEKITIKNLKNRWGSMTKEGSLNLNVNLLKAPADIIDYIILHELCHLKIKEHSHHYWDLVHKHMPYYQEKIDWLKINGTVLV